MGARDTGRRLLVGLVVLILLAACGAASTPTTPTTTPSSVSSTAATPAPSHTVAATRPAVAATPVPPSGPAGSMTTGRANHTATLLADGQVLLAGGDDASAELYDPATGAFGATGSLPSALTNQTATLLADGRVLIAGGAISSTPSAAAELYDPKTGTFSPTGSMSTARSGHTATLLANGHVLITGGWSGTDDLASAELYDPQTGTFSPTGSMATTRSGHTATLLSDGRVLVAAGWDATAVLNKTSVEIYDPRTGTFSATGSMRDPRGDFTSTLLADGHVLIAGGYSGTEALASAELYDVTTGTFSPTGSMSAPRVGQTATLLEDGRVLIVGGSSSTVDLASAELYDPKAGTFGPTGSMATVRSGHTATLLSDHRVLVAGGITNGFEAFASAELFDPETGTFVMTGSRLATIGTAADDGARIVKVDTVDARIRDLTIDSPAVGFVKVRLLLPDQYTAQPTAHWPLLYLLCGGGGGSHTDWTEKTDIEKLSASTDLLVVMPDAGESGFYTDWWNAGAGGPPKWETFHLVELLQLLERNWHAGDKRAIAGLSNGGLGAMDYAARHRGMFLAAASFSGVLDPVAAQAQGWGLPVAVWGDPTAQADVWKAHDPADDAAALKGTDVFVAYGNGQPGPLDPSGASPTGDDNAAVSSTFVAALTTLHIPVTVYAYGNGTHSWPYWQRDLHRWFPLMLKALGE